jgi:adenosine deaminase
MVFPRLTIRAACASALLLLPLAAFAADPTDEQRTAKYFESIRNSPVALEMFLHAMPKGGDLHNHIDGAIYAESFIAWAVKDGDCLTMATMSLSPPPCAAPAVPVADAVGNGETYAKLVDALSMRDFHATTESGHDHFFATFGKFGAASAGHRADMLVEVARRAASQNILYLELMTSPGMNKAREIGKAIPWPDESNFAVAYDAAMAQMAPLVAEVRATLDQNEAQMRATLGCNTPNPEPACGVTIRYLAQVIRTFPPQQVFAQDVLAYALASQDKRVVGVNLVAPEDDPVTLRDYTEQMWMLSFLGIKYPAVKLTLHAGELAMGLVPPGDLSFHIKQAVEIAKARRVGHAVDIAHERDAAGLLTEMADRHIMVEINLTSNDVILGITGAEHPFTTYRRYGVPVALSTDDEGVSRIDLTHEYVRVVHDFGLSYEELKTLERNSLEYSFLSGTSIWQTATPYTLVSVCAGAKPKPACDTLIAGSDRAAVQWKNEQAFAAFEARPR